MWFLATKIQNLGPLATLTIGTNHHNHKQEHLSFHGQIELAHTNKPLPT
jgi:hypothetical protein